MLGFIIRGDNGSYLSKVYYWFSHYSVEDCYVHPKSVLEDLRHYVNSNWSEKPLMAYEATYDEKKGVCLTGRIVDLKGMY